MLSFFTLPARPAFRRPGTHVLLGLGLLTTTAGRAQSTVSRYQFTASAGTFTPLVGGTAVPAILRNNTVSGSLPIGFTFTFGGVGYSSFQVSSNGLLGFGGNLSTAGAEMSNTLTSSQLTGGSLPVLAPFWTDLFGDASQGASAQYALSGTAPARVLTMEWLDYYDVNGDAPRFISFQVKLYEATGRIDYLYRRGPINEATDATIGLKAADGSFLSLTSAGSAPTVSSTTSYNRLIRPVTGQVYTFTPATTALAAAPALAAAEVQLFPNPAQTNLAVWVPAVAGASEVRATLCNSLGQVVRTQTAGLPGTGARLTVPTADLAAGIYSLRLQAGSATLTKQVMLSR